MKLNYDIDGTNSLRITDDKSHQQLFMDYDEQLEHYSAAMRNGEEGEVTPLDPIKRRPGEDNEIYFDRASALATRIYLNRLCEEIEVQSRYQRMQPLIAAVQHHLNHMELTCAHWDNGEPTEEELDQLQQLVFGLRNLDETLTTLS